MKRKTFLMGLLLALGILIAGITAASGAENLLGPYEPGEREFRRAEIGDKIVYFHQRTIGEAIVEKDFIVYQFDSDTKALLDKKVHWRREIPEDPACAAAVITKELAEARAQGEVVFSQLFIVSPESEIFPLDPTPENPCWVVTSVQDGYTVVTIMDAITGEWLGYGVPPPQVTGLSFTGPTSSDPCNGGWNVWYTNARDWFETMGYPTEDVSWPTEEKVRSHIQSNYTAMFYEAAHGGSTSFQSGCIDGTSYESTTATEVSNWIAEYTKMPFTFMATCDGMCSTGPGTFSYEFRKGSTEDTVTVGYCGMDDSHCWDPGTGHVCWSYAVPWQTALFSYMSNGLTVKAAYDGAMSDYPSCWPAEGACMRFVGDETFRVVPITFRTGPDTDGTVKAHQKISDTEGGFTGVLDDQDLFGSSVAALGDLDGDGVGDLAVGAFADDDGGTAHGAVWVLFLDTDGTVKAHQKISDTQGGFTGGLDNWDWFGHSVSALADLDGDGAGDLAVGAYGNDGGGAARGAVWVLFLDTDGTVKAHQKISDTEGGFTGALANGDGFGSSVAALGDLDGDGVGDLAIGSFGADDGGTNRGAVWVLFLDTDGTVKAHQKISDTQGGFTGGLNDQDSFGSSVAALGDLDGDGVGDVAVGAQGYDGVPEERGAVWVLFLNADGTVKAHQEISDTQGGFTGGLNDHDYFGSSVAALGDLDGDGVGDLAVGAENDDDGGTNRGAVWVLSLNGSAIVCGNSVLDPVEECDDGGTADGDGCSAVCEIEDRVVLSGQAQGGTVEVTVNQILVVVVTIPGQTAAQVIADLAAEINTDPTLAGLGTTALAQGRILVTNGTINSVTLGDPGLSKDWLINNGLAPPNATNVINDNIHEDSAVYVRNLGCPPGGADPSDPCPEPWRHWTEIAVENGGTAGEVKVYDSSIIKMDGGEVDSVIAYDSSTVLAALGYVQGDLDAYDSSTVVVSGADVMGGLHAYDFSTVTADGGYVEWLFGYDFSSVIIASGYVNELSLFGSSKATMSGGWMYYGLNAYDSSTVTISGGDVDSLIAKDSSSVTLSGGWLDYGVFAYDSASVTLSGGSLGYGLFARGSSTIRAVGTGFAVDGSPVSYGDLTPQSGTLTGTLESGDPIDISFCHGGGSCTGTITLVRPSVALQVPSFSLWGHLALVSCLIGFGLLGRRRRV